VNTLTSHVEKLMFMTVDVMRF